MSTGNDPDTVYSRIRVIGRGSYGEVWLVKHKKDKKQVGLKVMGIKVMDVVYINVVGIKVIATNKCFSTKL